VEFADKVIMLISSEAWGKIFISKHNYAVSLAELGNTVYFLNPMDEKLGRGEIKVEQSSTNKNLFIITYRPFFPWLFKFHARWLFDILIKQQVKKILNKLHTGIDIVWDFNCSYLYNDLSVFNAAIIIFHPVDKIGADVQNKKADIVFSVSPLILQDYKLPEIPRFLINHGLSKQFESISNEAPAARRNYNENIQAGYIGNILQTSMDRDIIKQLVSIHTNIDFTLIGPYSNKGNNICNDYSTDDEAFINFLNTCANVTLTGILTSEQIAKEISKFDFFFICYKDSQNYRCDNSHKVLEYLSTGKVIVSTPILFYKKSDLLVMSKNNSEYINLFSDVINNLDFYNSTELMARRKDFAKDNTYVKQIKKIEALINAHVAA
jgi:hypothetical protein